MKCKLCKVECTLGLNATEFGCDSCTKITRDEGGRILWFQESMDCTTPTHWDCDCDEDWIHEKFNSRICSRCGMGHYDCPDSHIIDVYNLSN